MTKKFFLSLAVVLVIFTLAAIPVLAETGPAKWGPPSTETPEPPEIPDTGELYGDLYVVLRDVFGAPILDANGCIQPIANEDETVFTLEDEIGSYTTIQIPTLDGMLDITAYAGEPFSMPYYYDLDGDLVACELTEEMAAWVQTVDFGRLNLGRAPNAVIDHALDEAINKMNLACAIELDPSGRIMLEIEENCQDDIEEWLTIDAPAENLALYIKMMTDGNWIIPDGTPTSRKGGSPTADVEERPVLNPDAIALISSFNGGIYDNLVDPDSSINDLEVYDLQLAASLLAGAADKFGNITLDMVIYINSIYGINQAAQTQNGLFNFASYQYQNLGGRSGVYLSRSSLECTRDGYIYVLQPVEETNYFEPLCVNILSVVQFNDYSETYKTEGIDDYTEYITNVRGFTQAADDSLQVLEYVHNYSVPLDLYVEE